MIDLFEEKICYRQSFSLFFGSKLPFFADNGKFSTVKKMFFADRGKI